MLCSLDNTASAVCQRHFMGLHWLPLASRRFLCLLSYRLHHAQRRAALIHTGAHAPALAASPLEQRLSSVRPPMCAAGHLRTAAPLRHTAHASWRLLEHEPPGSSADDGRQGTASSPDEGAGGLQGRHRRRLQGLPGHGGGTPNDSMERGPAAAASAAITHRKQRRLEANRDIGPTPLPPHLAADAGLAQQPAPLPAAAHDRSRPLQAGTSQQHEQLQAPGGRAWGPAGSDRIPSNGEVGSSSAAELTDTGDRAEGVLQFGNGGARIPLYGRSVESILQAVSQDRQRAAGAEGPFAGAGVPDQDGEEDALAVTFDQLPARWQSRRAFDWSGGTNYTALHRKVQEQRLAWDARRASGSTERVRLTLEAEAVDVLPLWVAVHQEREGGLTRLHQSTYAMSEELAAQLQQPLQPFCAVAGLRFEECDERAGPWRSYFVGVVGDVDAEEADVLWPNQVIHGARTMYNVRNGWDIARFLGDPVREDVEMHLANLQRLQEERQYRPGWCYRMLRLRWGEDVTRRFNLRMET